MVSTSNQRHTRTISYTIESVIIECGFDHTETLLYTWTRAFTHTDATDPKLCYLFNRTNRFISTTENAVKMWVDTVLLACSICDRNVCDCDNNMLHYSLCIFIVRLYGSSNRRPNNKQGQWNTGECVYECMHISTSTAQTRQLELLSSRNWWIFRFPSGKIGSEQNVCWSWDVVRNWTELRLHSMNISNAGEIYDKLCSGLYGLNVWRHCLVCRFFWIQTKKQV